MATTTFSVRNAGTGSEKISAGKLLWAAPLSGVIAAALNAVVYFLYTAVGFNIILPVPDLTDPAQLSTPLSLGFVVAASFLPALAAGGLLWALSKFTQRPVSYFIGISVLALLASFVLLVPLDMPTTFKIGLGVMHVIAAIVIIGGLTRFTRNN